MVKSGVKGGKFYLLPPDKKNTGTDKIKAISRLETTERLVTLIHVVLKEY